MLVGGGVIIKNKFCPVWTSYLYHSEVNPLTGRASNRYEVKLEILDSENYRASITDVFTGGLLSFTDSKLKSLEKTVNSFLPDKISYHVKFSRPRGIIKINLKNKGA